MEGAIHHRWFCCRSFRVRYAPHRQLVRTVVCRDDRSHRRHLSRHRPELACQQCFKSESQTKRATSYAMQISIENLGVVLGTRLYRSKWSPRCFVGHGTVRYFRSLPFTQTTPNSAHISFEPPRREHCLRKHLMTRYEEGE